MKLAATSMIAALLFAGQVLAGTHVGTIKTLNVNLSTGLAQVKFNEAVTFAGGTTCSNAFTGNSVDDDRFMNLVWPLLVMAKTRNLQVRVDTSTCLNGFPTIDAVDAEAR